MRLFAVASFVCGLLTSAAYAADSNKTSSFPAGVVLPAGFHPPKTFKNINILRNINLEKGYVREVLNVVIENIDKAPQQEYYLSFPPDISSNIGGLEVRDKSEPTKKKFEVEEAILPSESVGIIFLIPHVKEFLANRKVV